MGLRINNNVEAQDTLRNLTTAQNMFSLSMQRLSSGKRINSAADDAAGYAISNKLQAQSSGLDQAQSNAQDGISLIQTATGGLQTTQNLLQRMRQLAVQSANDTNTSSDRSALQAEADQISQEISQIAGTTQFNTKNLLDGSLGSTGNYGANDTIGGGAGALQTALTSSTPTATENLGSLVAGTYNLAITATGVAGSLGAAGTAIGTMGAGVYLGDAVNGLETDTGGVKDLAAGGANVYQLQITGGNGTASVAVNVGGTNATGDTYQNVVDNINKLTSTTGVTATYSATGIKLTNNLAGTSNSVSVTGDDVLLKGLGMTAPTGNAATTVAATASQAGTNGAATLQQATIVGTGAVDPTVYQLSGSGNVFTDAKSGYTLNLSGMTNEGTGATTLDGTGVLTVKSGAASLQVGANAGQNIQVSISSMTASALGVQGATTSQALDISSSAGAASSAITTIDAAIQTVSTQAANLGAVQNRLTNAISNLQIGSENMTAAFSQITDVNMAQESTNLATAQILQQSSTAMLAQANQAPQGILKLFG